MNLDEYLVKQNIPGGLVETIKCFAKLIIKTSKLIEEAPLNNQLGKLKQENVQGEQQTILDVESNSIFVNDLKKTDSVIGLVSEELEKPIYFEKKRTKDQYVVFFDPLDGSSNVSSNVSAGSIFSIYKINHDEPIEIKDFLQKGKEQIAAGFGVFGPSTILILTIGKGTFKFCFNKMLNEFVCTQENILIPEDAEEFSINMSNKRFWSDSISNYISDCQAGENGPRGKNFNMKWVASLVADINRILVRGGIYLYPLDRKNMKNGGRLRLMYEINPMAMIVEQCNGVCSDGIERILDITPKDIHQRTAVCIGAKNEAGIVKDYNLIHTNLKS
tara:strand:+ start:135 stop:1127 length:993 start_codon:yes stop_codon:yes gene_type:complete